MGWNAKGSANVAFTRMEEMEKGVPGMQYAMHMHATQKRMQNYAHTHACTHACTRSSSRIAQAMPDLQN
jgi:hypothetical protein